MFRARVLAARGERISFEARMTAAAYMALAVPAAFEDATVARGLLGIQHMRPPSVVAGLGLIARMLYLALRRLWRGKKIAPLTIRPPRSQVIAVPIESDE